MGLRSNTLARFHTYADLAGAAASTLCLLHCLLTPIVISFFPEVIPYLPGDASSHRALATVVILFGLAGFLPGYRLHRRKPLLILIALGMALILTVAWRAEDLSPTFELLFSLTGSSLLVTAHLLNRTFCRQCRTCKRTSSACRTTHID